MPRFSRKTVIAAVDLLESYGHSDITRFMLEHALENTGADVQGSKRDRANGVMRFLLRNPEMKTDDGANLTDAIVTDLVSRAAAHFDEGFDEYHPDLSRALKRDGFEVKDGTLRRVLPETLNLPAADDEVHELLDRFVFGVSKGHLDQAIQNHSDGNWAAANSQVRTFIESLFDEIAGRVACAWSGAAPIWTRTSYVPREHESAVLPQGSQRVLQIRLTSAATAGRWEVKEVTAYLNFDVPLRDQWREERVGRIISGFRVGTDTFVRVRGNNGNKAYRFDPVFLRQCLQAYGLGDLMVRIPMGLMR
jgi:hypothetical protein